MGYCNILCEVFAMKKQTWLRIGGICLLAAAAVIALGEILPLILVPLLLNMPAVSGDIGIIGGADGPTSIIVATSGRSGTVSDILIALALVIFGIILLKKAKR